MRGVLLAVYALVLAAFLSSSPAQSEIQIIPEALSDGGYFLVVEGEFEADLDTAEFLNLVERHDPSSVTFNSPGGNVYSAMDLGRAIRSRGLNTIQLRSFECSSACALAFVGGMKRIAEAGSIGVHKSSFSGVEWDSPDQAVSVIQTATADVMAYLTEMGVDQGLLETAFRYESTDMRYLSASEMDEFRVTALPSKSLAKNGSENKSWSRPVQPSHDEGSYPTAAISPPPEMASPPKRMAVYAGLDFYGSDIASGTVQDAAMCAAECTAYGDQCRAFSFNTSEKAKTGPNCFLKSDRGQMDGNSEAISGLLLMPSDQDPEPFSIGVIDHVEAIMRGVDVPGNDLSQTPHPTATSLGSCRMACVGNGMCFAFTFIEAKSECWLKSSGDGAQYRGGMVSAYKYLRSFSPVGITPIE